MTIPATRRRTSAKAKARARAAMCVVGYLRVSTTEQADSGLGLDALMTLGQAPQGCSTKVPTLSGGEGSGSELAARGLAERVGAGVVAA